MCEFLDRVEEKGKMEKAVETATELEARLSVYAHLAQAADDVKLGRVQSLDEACDDILAELDGLCAS